ncbi:MAG: calcium-binding protein [Tepidisphaeraceae bacterium]
MSPVDRLEPRRLMTGNVAPVVNLDAAAPAMEGTAYQRPFDPYDPNGDRVTVSLSGAPAWLSVVSPNATHNARLIGNVPFGLIGSVRFTVTVSDGSLSSSEVFTLKIAANPAAVDGQGVLHLGGTDFKDGVRVWRHAPGEFRVYSDYRTYNIHATVRSIRFEGLGGDDYFTANVGAIPVFADGGAGNDTLEGSAGNDTLLGGDGNDVIDGRAGRDSLYGNAGDDRLAGGADRDTLFGGAGRDILDGGAGRDILRGEAGQDLFFASDGAGDRVIGLAGQGDRAWFDRKDRLTDVALMTAA